MMSNLDHEQKVAWVFSVAINTTVIGILLTLGLSQIPKAKETIKGILVTPDMVKSMLNDAKTDITHSNVAEKVQSRDFKPTPTLLPKPNQSQPKAEPEPTPVEPKPVAKSEPVNSEPSKPESAKSEASKIEKVTANKPTEQTDLTLAARLRAEKAVRDAKLRAAENLKKEQAEKLKQKRDEQQALKEATKKTDTKAVDAKKADQKANDLKKAADDARKKAEADAKAKAADAKAKADADAKTKADAKAKSDADKRLKDLEDEAFNVGQKAQQDAAARKGEIKRLASNAKKDFENKIYRAWDIPSGSSGQKATARVTLSDNGAVLSVVVNSPNPDMKASVEAAIRAAAPYPMPSDPDARKEARSFTSTFTAK